MLLPCASLSMFLMRFEAWVKRAAARSKRNPGAEMSTTLCFPVYPHIISMYK